MSDRKDTMPYAEIPKEESAKTEDPYKDEDAKTKFKRVAAKRMEATIANIQGIGRLGESDRYEWTAEQKEKIFTRLSLEVRRAKAKYKEKKPEKKTDTSFSF